MYLIKRGLSGLGEALPTIKDLRDRLSTRLKKLGAYDLFLRDRSVVEWLKDNSAIVHWLVRTPAGRQRHEESHAFWTHLSGDERKSLVAKWVALMEAGAKLAGAGNVGGVGVGYGPSETAPPGKARAVQTWADEADAFIAQFEGVRQKKRILVRAESPGSSITGFLEHYKSIGTAVTVGIVGVLLVGVFIGMRGRR